MTADLVKRVYEHKQKVVEGFTQKYNVTKLVYYDQCGRIEGAIRREKQIKGWLRSKKKDLINTMNPEWKDLYAGLL